MESDHNAAHFYNQFFYLFTRSLPIATISLIYKQLNGLQGCSVAASYGMTDTMGRMHSDAQFAGSSSVPAHVEMMGFLGIGNNPMVGCTVACAVDVATALNK